MAVNAELTTLLGTAVERSAAALEPDDLLPPATLRVPAPAGAADDDGLGGDHR